MELRGAADRVDCRGRNLVATVVRGVFAVLSSSSQHGDCGCRLRAAIGALGWAVLLVVPPLASVCEAGLPDTIDKVRPAVVAVGTVQETRRPPAVFRATGFAVADGLHVLTNAHVLPDRLNTDQKEYLAVFVGRGKKSAARAATPVAVDHQHDLALLKIDGSPLPALTIDWSGRVREGQEVNFTGFPIGIVLGLYPVTHRGIVSARTPIVIPAPSTRQLDATQVERLKHPFEVLQLDAIAYPGNSGSPLYDPGSGHVLGVVNSVFVKESKEALLQQPSGISYAVPIEYAKGLFKQAGLTAR
jgi:serine protease Do